MCPQQIRVHFGGVKEFGIHTSHRNITISKVGLSSACVCWDREVLLLLLLTTLLVSCRVG